MVTLTHARPYAHKHTGPQREQGRVRAASAARSRQGLHGKRADPMARNSTKQSVRRFQSQRKRDTNLFRGVYNPAITPSFKIYFGRFINPAFIPR